MSKIHVIQCTACQVFVIQGEEARIRHADGHDETLCCTCFHKHYLFLDEQMVHTMEMEAKRTAEQERIMSDFAKEEAKFDPYHDVTFSHCEDPESQTICTGCDKIDTCDNATR